MRGITVAASAPCGASPRRTDLRPLRKYPAVASDLTLLKFRLLGRLTKCLVLHTHRRPDPKPHMPSGCGGVSSLRGPDAHAGPVRL